MLCREACDTHQSGSLVNGEYANEEIFTQCHPLICDQGASSAFYVYHPTNDRQQCAARNGQVVSHRRNVPRRYGTNLCMQRPQVPSKCAVPHGMLMNLQGKDVSSLYSSHVLRHRLDGSPVASAGAGLFWHGGNPIYYTAKGTEDDVAAQVHAVLRGHIDDLAGHHVVLKVSKERWTGHTFMRVDRTPLAGLASFGGSSEDAAVQAFKHAARSLATTWEVNGGWLYNLAGTMRMEQTVLRVDELYPKTAGTYSAVGSESIKNRWSCPLRRLSFWSKVTREFSPLVPSPARTARLFGEASGRNMLHGTRSHPTQMFASLYDKLANVVTSNGFCFCVDWQDCQVLSTGKECTLLDTIRSMYDEKFRTTQLLTQDDQVCTQQLDWPFVGGRLRDRMEVPSRYSSPAQVPTETAGNTCNVLDRLPPFQYRYRASGRVAKPADGKTSLSEGGSCHMGRAARLPSNAASLNTRLCRKIHTNHTHIVARCFGASGSTSFVVRASFALQLYCSGHGKQVWFARACENMARDA